jgi:TetR/AcrR family transcriptional repressor of nem operon
MRVSREEKERSRQRIVAAAARRVRARGIAGTSVAEVMADAELTHGGFYRHFASKDELVAAAFEAAFTEMLLPLESATSPAEHVAARQDYLSRYLSVQHVASPAMGCPIAALGSEVPRESAHVQGAFAVGVMRTARALYGPAASDRAPSVDEELGLISALVGAVVLARASTPEVAREILSAARRRVGVH